MAIVQTPIYAKERRYICPRECARLQSFPDSFIMHEKQMKTWLRSGRIDLVKSTMKNLIDYLKVKSNVAKYKEDKKQKENLLLFIGNLPGDNREELISWLAGVGIEVNSSGKGK